MGLAHALWKAYHSRNTLALWLANIAIRPLKKESSRRLLAEVAEGKIRRVAVNRPDGIGDAVVSAKFVKALAKSFPSVEVVASENNRFVYKEEKIPVAHSGDSRNFFDRRRRALFLAREILCAPLGFLQKNAREYDLMVDLAGHVFVEGHSARHTIGPNKGPFSIFYSNFARKGFGMPDSPNIVESYISLARNCIGIGLEIDDCPPKGFVAKKQRQVMILVGGKKHKDIQYGKWKEIALFASRFAKCIIADGPSQLVVSRMKNDPQIASNRKITLIGKAQSLQALAKRANRSALFIAVDGGGQHYLERCTNSITIYTCTLPNPWKPYSKNPYKKERLADGHILERSTTSAGLEKAAFYRVENRMPCYDLFCDAAYGEMNRKLDVSHLEGVIEEMLSKRIRGKLDRK